MKRYLIIVAIILAAVADSANAQKVGVKTNTLSWTTATPNVGFEFALGEKWTAEFMGAYNPWTFNKEKNRKAKHWLVTPELRYWFCESFQGHFIGINGNYSQFNVGAMPIPNAFINLRSNAPKGESLKDSRIAGWAAGAGLTYGYQFMISSRWNLELTAGFGWWYTEYDRFESRKCGKFEESTYKHALGPTSLGVSFIYLIK